MGLIQSVICGIVLCFERVVSWTCCALVIVTVMAMVMLLTVYGITLGYHYGQKQLAKAASDRNSDSKPASKGSGRAVVRLVAVNRTQGELATDIAIGQVYQTRPIAESVYLEPSPTPIVVLESERPSQDLELTSHERELARKIIGRFRRNRIASSTNIIVISPGDMNVTLRTITTDVI